MAQCQGGKAASAPAEAVGFHLVHGVPPRGSEQSSDILPACTTVDLGGAADMKSGGRFNLKISFHFMADHSASNTQSRIGGKFGKGLLEVLRLE